MSDYGTTSQTVTAFFDSRMEADRAVERLTDAGVPRSAISVVAGAEGTTATAKDDDSLGFWDALTDLFMPDEDRYSYAEGLKRGGYVVTVRASGAHAATAMDILEENNAVDIGERETAWRSEGWAGYQPDVFEKRRSALETGASATAALKTPNMPAAGATGRAYATGTSGRDEEVISVAEEQLRVGKRDVSHGRVRVRSYVVETPVTEQVDLREEHVTIQRRPVDRALTGDERLFQDKTIEVEERAEEAVIAKEARVKEELVISKNVEHRTDTVSDTVRRTEVEVDDDRSVDAGRVTETEFSTTKKTGTGPGRI